MNDTQPSLHPGDKVCRAANYWIDVVKFFAFNLALHALTVVPRPGANLLESAATSLFALLVPASGVGRATSVLYRLVFLWGGSELEHALNAGALCTLVPAGCPLRAQCTDDQDAPAAAGVAPPQDLVPAGFDARELEQVNPLTTNVHGQYPADIRKLYTESPGENGAERLEYSLVTVPVSFSALPLLATHVEQHCLLRRFWDKLRGRPATIRGALPVPLALSCNYSLLKTSAALLQILYGSYELYMVSDEQIQQYGYAAYQFLVIPYVGMSILNLLAGLSAPSYPARYIVHYRGLNRQSSVRDRAASVDPPERRTQAVMSGIPTPAEGAPPDMPNGAAPMRSLEEEEEEEGGNTCRAGGTRRSGLKLRGSWAVRLAMSTQFRGHEKYKGLRLTATGDSFKVCLVRVS